MNKNNYNEFANIEVDSLTMFWGHSRNKASYNRLKSNEIKTLQDLFQKYDSDSLVFPLYDHDGNAQARGIIELIRIEFLKADTLLDVYLEKEISPYNIIGKADRRYFDVITYCRSLGLGRKQAISIARYIGKNLKQPMLLGQIIYDLSLSDIDSTSISINEMEDFKIKLSILKEYYKKRFSNPIKETKTEDVPVLSDPIICDMYIKSLEEEERTLLERREHLDKKISLVQSKLAELKQQKKEGKRL